jgi:hypothetical protein
VHIGDSEVLLTAAIVLGLLALSARGPLGVVRICGSRLHGTLDVVAGVLLALSPLVRALRPGVIGIVAIEVVALAWLRVTMLTRYTARADATDSGVAVGAGVEAGSVMEAGPGSGEASSGPALSGPALAAGRGLGRMTARARNRLPEGRATLDSGARRMGAGAGRLQRAWRRATG